MPIARGIDISEHQDWLTQPLLRDWRTRYPGMCYGYCRASIGMRTDLRVRQHREKLLAEGYLTGIYHALHEDDNMVGQCQRFLSLRDPRDTLPLWADIEREGLTEEMVHLWCDTFDNLSNAALWIYTSRAAFETIIKLNFARYDQYGLVVADYGPGKITSEPWIPPPGRPFIPQPWIVQAPPHYEMWQYAGDNGRLQGSGKIDLSQYRGTEAELRARFEKEPVPIPVPPNGDDMLIMEHADKILEAL